MSLRRSRQSEGRVVRWPRLSSLIAVQSEVSPMVTASQHQGPLAVNEVLRIAHDDAMGVYHDLSGLKITLTLSPDGWHVDYNLTDPLSAGGGPHYLIDPQTGTILSRRYDQ